MPADSEDPRLDDIAALGARMADVRQEVARAIHGQVDVVDQTLICLLAGGHVLLVGVPGLGKSRLVETLSVVLGLDANRIQFTPDLMPPEITGFETQDIDENGRRAFRFVPGPVFCQFLMADEINRASPRTQAALLQAMQERRVSIAGVEHRLPEPFHVLATQNPIEQEGTYPLPEAQLDRFLLEVEVTYPDFASERSMLIATTGPAETPPARVLDAPQLLAAQALVRAMPVGETVLDAILALVRNGRPESTDEALVRDNIAWGPGPRAAQALMLTCRARALLDGRLAPSVDDVAALAPAVLRHRMALTYEARARGVTLSDIIARLVERLG
jgi:MoxR-like ATPase